MSVVLLSCSSKVEVLFKLRLFPHLQFHLFSQLQAGIRGDSFPVGTNVPDLFAAFALAGGLQQYTVDEALDDVAVFFPGDKATFAHMLPGIGPQVRPVELVEEEIFPVIPAVYPDTTAPGSHWRS